MNVNLPYEIGTILKKEEFGKTRYDKLHHYIVGDELHAVVVLDYQTNPRLSVPIDIDRLQKEWIVCDSDC